MKQKTCCFIGHQKIKDTPMLREALAKILEDLIVNKKFNTFLFGSMSEFYPVCYDVVTQLKARYPHIRRIYVRCDFPYLDGKDKAKLLAQYEDTYFSKPMHANVKADYVERNLRMILSSQVCVILFKNRNRVSNTPDGQPKSGTKVAYDYAVKKGKQIINLYDHLPTVSRKPPARRKPGTGSLCKLKSGLWIGSFSPLDATGKRVRHCVYGKTRQECELSLADLIVQVKAQIANEKENQQEAVLL